MESIWLYLVILLVSGTWEETSAIMGKLNLRKSFSRRPHPKKPVNHRKIKILEEAKAAFAGAGTEVRFNLAPSYGNLDSEMLQELDESLQVMIGGILQMDMHKGVTWNEVRSALDTSPLIIRQPDFSVSKLNRISFDSVRFLGFNSNKNDRMLKIRSWFSKLIGNVDILEDTDIDLYSLASMVSKMTFRILKNVLTHKIRKMTLIDLGILRFPDISQPFFTLYRINLMGKCSYHTYIVHQKETSDVVGLFQKEVYYPNQDYISNMSNDLMDQLLSEVDDLFSDY